MAAPRVSDFLSAEYEAVFKEYAVSSLADQLEVILLEEDDSRHFPLVIKWVHEMVHSLGSEATWCPHPLPAYLGTTNAVLAPWNCLTAIMVSSACSSNTRWSFSPVRFRMSRLQ